MIWIFASILAAFFQTIRTGLQKQLKNHLTTHAINWVRYGFGLPFVLCYVALLSSFGYVIPNPMNEIFLLYCLGTAFAQIIATGLLISLFSYRNFSVGTTYAKTETIQTAFLGFILFSESMSWMGLIAIVIGLVGILAICVVEDKLNPKALLRGITSKTARIGLSAGLFFSLAGLFIRQANLQLESGFLENAALTLLTVIVMQVTLLGIWIARNHYKEFAAIMTHWKCSALVGLTSTLGSIGWFTAFALTNAAYVKAVGQIELLFALFITYHIFKEPIKKIELIGMILVVGSILLLMIGT